MPAKTTPEKRGETRSSATKEEAVPRWVQVSERPPEVTEGGCTILLFQNWEREFNSREWYLVQHVRPLYANVDYVDNTKGCTAWLHLPPFPPLEKP